MGFKVGDKLRYVKCSSVWYTKGAVYEVASIEEDEGVVWIVINDNKGLYTGWKPADIPESFERIDKPQQPQVTKVKLTQEQAKAIEAGLENVGVELLLDAHIQSVLLGKKWESEEYKALNELNIMKLSRALLIGYEVEQTAEEKLVEYYQERKERAQKALARDERHERDIYAAQVQAINATLSLLGIKVKGINSND